MNRILYVFIFILILSGCNINNNKNLKSEDGFEIREYILDNLSDKWDCTVSSNVKNEQVNLTVSLYGDIVLHRYFKEFAVEVTNLFFEIMDDKNIKEGSIEGIYITYAPTSEDNTYIIWHSLDGVYGTLTDFSDKDILLKNQFTCDIDMISQLFN